ncbi:zinc finger protein 32-like isoform X2 [Phymastichus coffea]|uniref:zinc finger protein 32-like isoform X2 n=1 Tax=Phymastichus coffea TaxID=108790 RepID=UPI00273CD40D|nr:zinc finger protein 32-like isoform X2 [Phymastichus coffea]
MASQERQVGDEHSETEPVDDELAEHECCRICAATVPPAEAAAAARIFGQEGRRRNLQRNIRKYLYITVSSEDKLPKMVCASCVGKLDGIHAFATMALRSQEKLKQELLKTPPDLPVTVDSLDSSDSLPNKLGERGLLHSILTKGSSEAANDGESLPDHPSSGEYSDFSDDSDRDVSSQCSPISEPPPLTKKEKHKNSKEYVSESLDEKIRDNNENEDLNDSGDDKNVEGDEFEEVEDFSDSESKPHVCKICTRAFVSQIALQNHLWSHLPTSTDDSQDISPRQRTGANGVTSQSYGCDNLLTNHFICPICGKKISTKGNLKVHLETHRPKGKYGCDICGRIFKTQSNLFRHKEYHSGVQFPCSVCGRVYPTNSTLRAHSITHSDLRPHACPLCDKTFKRNQDLKFHINQHTGARPYQCPYCPKAFASSGNCFSHRKRMHPKEVNRDRQRAADLMR